MLTSLLQVLLCCVLHHFVWYSIRKEDEEERESFPTTHSSAPDEPKKSVPSKLVDLGAAATYASSQTPTQQPKSQQQQSDPFQEMFGDFSSAPSQPVPQQPQQPQQQQTTVPSGERGWVLGKGGWVSDERGWVLDKGGWVSDEGGWVKVLLCDDTAHRENFEHTKFSKFTKTALEGKCCDF